jgi:hypothetical protein
MEEVKKFMQRRRFPARGETDEWQALTMLERKTKGQEQKEMQKGEIVGGDISKVQHP